MWIGGDAIMFAVMMIVFAAWARDPRASLGQGWLGPARRANLERLTAARSAPQPAAPPGAAPPPARRGPASADDEEHLAAYNAYLARLHHQADDSGAVK